MIKERSALSVPRHERPAGHADATAQSSRIAIPANQSHAVRERPPTEAATPLLGQPARLAHGQRLRRALEDLLDLLLQRAPVEAGVLLQTLDGLLVKAPREDRAHPVLLHTRPVDTRESHWSAQRWLPCGCHSERICDRLRGSRTRRT